VKSKATLRLREKGSKVRGLVPTFLSNVAHTFVNPMLLLMHYLPMVIGLIFAAHAHNCYYGRPMQ